MKKLEGILWIILISVLSNLICSAYDCAAFNNRWTRNQTKRTWGKQILSESRRMFRLLTLNCSYETMDESVVSCTSIVKPDPIYLLTLIRCPLYNFDLGSFLDGTPVTELQFLYDGPTLTNLSIVLHDKINVSKISVLKVKANKVFRMTVANETRSIKQIDIQSHDLTSIGKETDWTLLSQLEEIAIKNGLLESFSPRLSNSLKKMDLSGNRLKDISPETFENLNFLTELYLSNNRFTEFDDTILSKLPLLSILELSRNQMKRLRSLNSNSLTRVVLSSNQLSRMRKGTLNMRKLTDLDLSRNELSTLEDGAFNLENLTNLDLTGNKLTAIGEKAFNLNRLTTLKLSRNSGLVLHETNPFGTSKKLATVEATSCQLQKLPYIHGKRDDTLTMDFSENRMANIILPLYSDSEKQVIIGNSDIAIIHVDSNFVLNTYDKPISYFILGNQPVCNCSLWTFLKFVREPNASSIFRNIERMVCRSGKPLKDAFQNMFCPGRTCPRQCSCGAVVNCSDSGFFVAPASIPLNVTKVHLQKNFIASLRNTKPEYWNHVTHLYLSHNNLTTLDGWNIPTSLTVLAIDYNHLERLPSLLMQKVQAVSDFRISVAGNNWKCDCPTMLFMKLNAPQKIVDSNYTTCSVLGSNKSFSDFPIRELPTDRLCAPAKIALLVNLAILIVLLLVSAGFVYRFKGTVLASMYSRNLVPSFFFKPVQDDKEYDILVLYGESDREKVNQMSSELEPQNRLFIPGRDSVKLDAPASEISKWIQKSSIVLLLMSKNSPETKEFQEQCQIAFRCKKKEKTASLIPIISGDLKEALGVLMKEEDMRQILLTYPNMIWGERWFWQKLRLALRREGAGKRKWGKVRLAWQRGEESSEGSLNKLDAIQPVTNRKD